MNDAERHPDETALDLWRTGELEAPEAARVEAHLASCESCAERAAALEAFARTVADGYRAVEEGGPEPDWAGLRSGIAARTTAAAAGAARRRAWLPRLAVAVVALLAMGVLWEVNVRSPGEAERFRRSVTGPEAATDSGPPRVARGLDTLVPPPAPAAAERDRAPAEAADEVAETEIRQDAGRVARNEAPAAPAEEKAAHEDQVVGAMKKAQPSPAAQAAARGQLEAGARFAASDVRRFLENGRAALATGDSAAAAEALALWRDTLAPRVDADLALADTARVVADSLSAFLARRP